MARIKALPYQEGAASLQGRLGASLFFACDDKELLAFGCAHGHKCLRALLDKLVMAGVLSAYDQL